MPRTKETTWRHLSAQGLAAFESDSLPEEHAVEVEAHLTVCAACCHALSALPLDSFLTRLRLAYQTSPRRPASEPLGTPPPQETIAFAPPSGSPALPGFENLRELGRGGMGVVYAATHAVMDRRVAVKVVNPEFSCHPVAVERFRREVRAAARLAHPNIVIAHAAGQAGDRPFLVMELVEGESLVDRVRRLGPLPVAEACDAVRQAALGLQHAHDNGLVHRDIKPHNLMRTSDGVVKVLDFGLAALTEDAGRGAGQTGPNAVMGTPEYMAPGQTEDARSADGRADVYSLGCTLFHLLTGKVPFDMESTLLKLLAHRTNERPSARAARPEVPAELDAVLRRAMARRPEERPPTPGNLAAALVPFADSAQIATTRHRRRRRPLVALAALLLMAATVAAAVVRLPAGKDREIVIETDDAEVEVVVKGERIVRIVDPKTGRAYRLDREDLTLSLVDEPDGLAVTLDGNNPVVLKRQGKQIATVRLEPKSDLVAPEKIGEGQPVRLFNGKDLTGWELDSGPRGAWRVVNGAIVGRGQGSNTRGWLLSEHSYSNFLLSCQFQLAEGADGGVGIRARDGERIDGLPMHLAVKLRTSPSLIAQTGSLYYWPNLAEAPARPANLEPPGSWNNLVIGLVGQKLRVVVNSEVIQDLDLDRIARRDKVMPGVTRSSGRIGLQQHSGEVRFRDLEIIELPPPKKAAVQGLPEKEASVAEFLDPANWQGLDPYWRVTDGVITGATGTDRFDFNTFLCSRKKYRDFELQFQVRVTGKGWAGNSGVQIRSTLVDREKFMVRGPQCDMGDDYWGNLYGELSGGMMKQALWEVAARGAGAGAFKDYFIRCVGKHVTIRVNGRTTVDEEVDQLPDEGIIAWQLHGGEPMTVTFRDIVFKELPPPAKIGEVRRFGGHHALARTAVFAPDGKQLYSCGDDSTVRMWEGATGQELRCWDFPGRVLDLALSRDGKRLVAVTDQRLYHWRLGAGQEPRGLDAVSGPLMKAAVNPDGTKAVAGAVDGTIRIWDLRTGRVVREWLPGPLGNPVNGAIDWSADGTRIVTGGDAGGERGGWLDVWDAETGVRLRRLANRTGTIDAAFTPDGQRIVSSEWSGLVQVRDVDTGETVRTINVGGWGVRSFVSPDGRRAILCPGKSESAAVWDLENGRQVEGLDGPGRLAWSGVFSPDGRLALTCGWDGSLQLWRLPD